jgi:Fe-S-cluster containining protein
MIDTAPELPEALRDKRKLDQDERFRFACHSELPCFNQCCSDVNIILTPYDVLRLARRLGISTTEFLDRYALLPITKDLQLPVVMLKMGEAPARKCHFVGEQGCTVYEDRPWACRMYPLGVAVPPARAGVEPEPIHFLFEDDFCKGHGEAADWSPLQWRADQGVDHHEEMERGYRELVSHPWFIGGRQLDPRRMEMFHTACYDLDRFRGFIFESTFLSRFELEPELVEQLRTDDLALLRFAFRWLRYALFAEPTMTVRPDAPSSPRKA